MQNPGVPYGALLLLAFLAGIGGGNFSGFMPSTSYFFPKRLQGTALGLQAGIGNFGVSIVQFVTPWVIGFALFGSLLGGPQTFTPKPGVSQPIWLQNATLVWVPLVLLGAFSPGSTSGACPYGPTSASSWTSSGTSTPGS